MPTPYLTNDSLVDRMARDTHPGQAFWGGSGPAGKTCRECVHFEPESPSPWLAATGELKAGHCAQYRHLMQGKDGTRIPHHAKACKYFTQSDKPTPQWQPTTRREP